MIDIYAGRREHAGREGLRGGNGPLDHVGPEIDRVGVGRVVAGQQFLVRKPETVVAAEDRLEFGAVGGQDAGANAKRRKWYCGVRVEGADVRSGSSHTVTAEDDHLLELRIVD